MAKDEGWGRRLRTARRAYEERHDGGLTYEAIGERLGKLLKRPAFKHSTVRAWFVDGQEPDSFAVATALARVLETDPGYLITGHEKGPAEAEPIIPPGATNVRTNLPNPDAPESATLAAPRPHTRRRAGGD